MAIKPKPQKAGAKTHLKAKAGKKVKRASPAKPKPRPQQRRKRKSNTLPRAKGGPGGKPEHAPTPGTQNKVELMAAVGSTQNHIARTLGITKPTLVKHYREELDYGMARANSQVASNLYEICMGRRTLHYPSEGPGKPPKTIQEDVPVTTQRMACEFWLDRRFDGWQKREQRSLVGEGGGPVNVQARIVVYRIPDNGRLIDPSVIVDPEGDVSDAVFDVLPGAGS